MKEINLDQILEENAPITCSVLTTGSVNSIKAAIIEACKQVLELAAENATCEGISDDGEWRINKQSILDTINQVK